jgi:hypothetical protein
LGGPFYLFPGLPSSSGNLAIFAAIRRAVAGCMPGAASISDAPMAAWLTGMLEGLADNEIAGLFRHAADELDAAMKVEPAA